MLHEGSCKGGGVKGVNVYQDGKPCQVAHGCEVVGASKVGLNLARLPNIDVDDGKWGGDRPRVDKLALVAGGGVGQVAVGAGFDPGFYIRPHFVPIEPESDSVECFVGHEVPCRRGGVEGAEQSVAQGGWGDDEKEGSAVDVQGLGVGEPVVVEADEAISEGGRVSRRQFPED